MNKERKQDLQGPEEEAVEERIREMMDINVPDNENKPAEVSAPEVPSTKKGAKIVPISVSDDEKTAPPEAPKDAELMAAIEAANAELSATTGTAPLVESKKSSPKKVEISHIQDEPAVEEPAVPQPEPEEPAIEPAESEVESDEPIETEKVEAETNKTATVGELMDAESSLQSTLDSPETDQAVSDIIAHESDELLAVQDKKVESTPKKNQKTKKDHPSLIKLFVTSSAFRWGLFLLVIVGLVVLGALPSTRYYALNKAGVRSSASVVISDQATLRPLKNAKVSIAGQSATTDATGRATLTQLKLGSTELTIEKRAYASEKQKVTIGWGSNPLTGVNLKPQGSQYGFQVTDVFSDKPLANVEASVGDQVAASDAKGEIILTLDKVDTDKITVLLKANGYRDQTVDVNLNTKDVTKVQMTPSKQVAFITKRSGKYDLYKIDADGKNESLVLSATGKESGDIALVQHPTDPIAMLISSREGSYNSDGKLQKNLTFVNLKDGTNKAVAKSSQLQAIDWVGTRLVYVMLTDETNPDDPNRFKLMSYDYVSGDNRQLASTNYFNSVVSAAGKIYYAPSSAYQNGVNLGVFVVHADGSGKDVLLNQESWNMVRTAYDSIVIAVQQDWYGYKPGDKTPQKLSGQPTDTTSQVFVDSPDGKHSVWLDNRDGKGVIVVYDVAQKSEKVLLSENGLSGPLRWLNNSTVVYRLVGQRETADYLVSLDGGTAHKVADVTNTVGIDRWAY